MTRMVEVGAYRIVGDRDALDMDVVHRALSQDSYWARGRSRADNERAFANSRVAVALDASADGRGTTVAFARAVTDGVSHAWLADVWVEPAHRGRGLGRAVIAWLLDAPDLAEVRRWALVTSDAQPLYESFGFREYAAPPTMMERLHPPGWTRSR